MERRPFNTWGAAAWGNAGDVTSEQETGTPTIDCIAAQLAQFRSRSQSIGVHQAYPGPQMSSDSSLLGIAELSSHLRMDSINTTLPNSTRSSSGINNSHYAPVLTSHHAAQHAPATFTQQPQPQPQLLQQQHNQTWWPQAGPAWPEGPSSVLSLFSNLPQPTHQTFHPDTGAKSFAAYEACYGPACKCDTGACAHEAELPCAAHRCVCCKVGRQVAQYSRQAWCGPCGKREVVAGLKFVRCGRCQSEMLAEMLPAHLKQNVAILDGEGKKVTGRCMGSTREVVTTDKGRRCGKCTNMRPVTFFSTDDANCTCNMHTLTKLPAQPAAAASPAQPPPAVARLSSPGPPSPTGSGEPFLSVANAPSIIQANMVLDSARGALSSLCHASTALTSVIQLCQEVIQGQQQQQQQQDPPPRLRDAAADQASRLSAELESGARKLNTLFQLFSAITAKPQASTSQLQATRPASQSSSLPSPSNPTALNGHCSTTSPLEMTTSTTMQGPPSNTGSVGLPTTPTAARGLLAALSVGGTSTTVPTSSHASGGLHASAGSGVFQPVGITEGGPSLCGWQLSAAEVPTNRPAPLHAAGSHHVLLRSPSPITHQLLSFNQAASRGLPAAGAQPMDTEPQPPPLLPGGSGLSADRVAKRGWVEGEEAVAVGGGGGDGGQDGDDQQLKRWRF